jgi:thiol-disulfide isomerase/thioredoxin
MRGGFGSDGPVCDASIFADGCFNSIYFEFMRLFLIFGTALLALGGGAETPAAKLWNELQAKREKLPGVHQEFDVSRTYTLTNGTQSSKWQIVLDLSQGQWREKSVSGSGNRLKIFDGKDLFSMEESGDEYVRVKRRSKDPDPVPSPYLPNEADWTKSQELERLPCNLPGKDDSCVVLEVRLKPWSRTNSPSNVTAMLQGAARMLIDTETGLIVSLRVVEVIQNPRSSYHSEVSYTLTRVTLGARADDRLFKVPSDGVREVKELSRWNASRIKKQLAGKPAPELTVTDIEGKPVVLSAFKGKTVLLDFWTTWCPPCRADAPALDKLYRKYGEKDLMIIGVSVSEERSIVEKFLKEHPHGFPVVLTTENEMPTAYQVGAFPTYIVIERDGTLTSAVEGDQGFSDLRKLLKKAGLELE